MTPPQDDSANESVVEIPGRDEVMVFELVADWFRDHDRWRAVSINIAHSAEEVIATMTVEANKAEDVPERHPHGTPKRAS